MPKKKKKDIKNIETNNTGLLKIESIAWSGNVERKVEYEYVN